MKHQIQLFLTTALMLTALCSLSACGQKGPLIIDAPNKQGVISSQEVTDNDSVLNTQSEDNSTSR